MINKKFLAVMLSACMVLGSAGCGKSKNESLTLPLPSWLSRDTSISLEGEKSSKSKVHFYYDNTTSMYPFVCDSSGKSTGKKGAAVSGPLVNWISAIREILQDNGGSSYTLALDEKDELTWQEYKGDIHNNFSNKSFYTFKGDLPIDGDASVGPLTQLYGYGKADIALNKEAINIVLTDLAEQSVNNTALASVINQKILSQEGYSVAIIAVECNFNGMSQVPNPNKVSNIVSKKVNGKRPLYMILTGKNDELEDIYDKLLKAMQQQGLKENRDYYTHYRQAGAATGGVQTSNVVVAPLLKESDQKSFKKYFENSVFYDNLALKQFTESETADLFGEKEYLSVGVNAFQYEKAPGTDRMVLNYYIPINADTNSDAEIKFRVGMSMQDDEKNIESEDASQVIENKDYIIYDYLLSETVETEEEPEEEEPAEEEGKRTRRRKKSKSRKTKETVQKWYCNDSQTTTLKDFQDSFDIKVEEIDPFEMGNEGIIDGVEIYDKDKERIQVGSDGERGSKTYELDPEDAIDLSGANRWLHISIEGKKEKYDSSTVAFAIPVYAFVSENDNVPQWVTDLNVDASEVSSSSFYTRTFNLAGFYSNLFGAATNGSEFDTQVAQEMKIADINTVITGLPAEKSKR